jgi:hypothetical protein
LLTWVLTFQRGLKWCRNYCLLSFVISHPISDTSQYLFKLHSKIFSLFIKVLCSFFFSNGLLMKALLYDLEKVEWVWLKGLQIVHLFYSWNQAIGWSHLLLLLCSFASSRNVFLPGTPMSPLADKITNHDIIIITIIIFFKF